MCTDYFPPSFGPTGQGEFIKRWLATGSFWANHLNWSNRSIPGGNVRAHKWPVLHENGHARYSACGTRNKAESVTDKASTYRFFSVSGSVSVYSPETENGYEGLRRVRMYSRFFVHGCEAILPKCLAVENSTKNSTVVHLRKIVGTHDTSNVVKVRTWRSHVSWALSVLRLLKRP